MHRYEVAADKLLLYQNLAAKEAVRAVRELSGVLGMFVTAEHDKPNIIHTLELFSDQASYDSYLHSQEYMDLNKKTASMFIKSHTVKNLQVNIPLSSKGLQKTSN